VEVVVPVEDMGAMGQVINELRSGPASSALQGQRSSIWPSIYPRILQQVLAHRTTIIICNARRQAERLAARLNELAHDEGIVGEEGQSVELVKAHHGSLAREQRVTIEDELKRGELRAIVATSSLELGIDMGAVDLVIQVESPGAVSRGLQRIGRAGREAEREVDAQQDAVAPLEAAAEQVGKLFERLGARRRIARLEVQLHARVGREGADPDRVGTGGGFGGGAPVHHHITLEQAGHRTLLSDMQPRLTRQEFKTGVRAGRGKPSQDMVMLEGVGEHFGRSSFALSSKGGLGHPLLHPDQCW
jgi:hypothetical protein